MTNFRELQLLMFYDTFMCAITILVNRNIIMCFILAAARSRRPTANEQMRSLLPTMSIRYRKTR